MRSSVTPAPAETDLSSLRRGGEPPSTRSTTSSTRGSKSQKTNKVHRHTRTPPGKFNVPDKRFVWSHIDLVGPLPPSCGFTWIMTIIERTTRDLEAIPLRDATAQTVADAYLLHRVAKFRVPGHLTSGRGVQFT